MTSTDNIGAGNGTQALLPIQAPIDVCGNAVGVAGGGFAGCEGGAAAALDPEWTYAHFQDESGPTMISTGNTGLLNGTQLLAPVQAPVNVCGNAVAVLGAAGASCEGGAKAEQGDRDHKKYGKKRSHGKGYGSYQEAGHHRDAREPGRGTTMVTADNTGLLNGTQLLAPIQLPINLCGNAIAVLGTAQAECEGGASAAQQL